MMTRKICLVLLLNLFLIGLSRATAQVSTDSLLTILQQKESPQRERQVVLAIRYYFQGRVPATLPAAKTSIDSVLKVHLQPNAEALGLFVETMYRMKQNHFVEAEKALVHAISLADKAEDHYLLYGCFTQLAILQTITGNTTDALSSFRQARNEAATLNDAYLQVMVDINIADIYHRNKLYEQSLLYLNQAAVLIQHRRLKGSELDMMVLVNKVENYFSQESADSLAKYNRLLLDFKLASPRLYSFQQRSTYMLSLLQGHYNEALQLLGKLKTDPHFAYDETDDQNLTNALYHSGQIDSARTVALRLVTSPALQNHPEVTLPLYEMLARIAVNKSQKDTAIGRFDEALQQAKLQITRLVKVDTIAARLRLDDMQNSYLRREGGFKRERLWLIFGVVTISLILMVGAMFYRSNQQKRKYERLFFESKRKELSFINSHEIRRHLSNIMGIIETIRHSDDRHKDYTEAETHLLNAANDLDRSIREIAAKLNDDVN